MFSLKASVADHLTNDGTILLLDKILIILDPFTPSRKRDLLGVTISKQALIDEFAPIIRTHPQDRKRKERSRLLQRRHDGLCALGAQGQAFGPACRNIGKGQRGEIASIKVRPTMSDHIHFQKTGLRLIPLLEGANGDLLLEQGSGTHRRKTTLTMGARPTQETIGGDSTHPEELPTTGIGQVKMSMPLQRFQMSCEIGHEPFRTNLIGVLPDEKQSTLDFWSERSLSLTLRRWRHLV